MRFERSLRDEALSALQAGDPLPRLAWAIPRRLAISQRPLRAHPMYGGSRRDYPPEARPDIDAWIDDVVRRGIRSGIVLTTFMELQHYAVVVPGDGGLLSAYREAGFDVHTCQRMIRYTT